MKLDLAFELHAWESAVNKKIHITGSGFGGVAMGVELLWGLNLSEYASQTQLFTDVLHDFRHTNTARPSLLHAEVVREVAKLLGCLDCGVERKTYFKSLKLERRTRGRLRS